MMKETSNTARNLFPAVVSYKALLKEYLDRRPSGIRQKLASSLGTHKSFISQITNPQYRVPIPAQHVSAIMSICHFSEEERNSFMSAYLAAHPGVHFAAGETDATDRHIVSIEIPDLGDSGKEHEIADAIRQTAALMISLAKPTNQ